MQAPIAMSLKTPYVLFLGDAPDFLSIKTAIGVAKWRPDWCIGQIRLPGCQADAGLTDMTVAEARAAGAQTLVIGVANRGGIIPDTWLESLQEAIAHGFDIASGLHKRLIDIDALSDAAQAQGVRLIDVRYPQEPLPVATGEKRSGKRLLTVGTDCAVGKMFTALAIEREMKSRGLNADFRATGQTGIFIAGDGVPVDAVKADFISGSVELLTPPNDADHWDVIEGQGSLFHASFAGVSLGLLHGAQADALVMCHVPNRPHVRGLPSYVLPSLPECIYLNEQMGRLTNPNCRVIGVSINTSQFDEEEAKTYLEATEAEVGLPTVDAYRLGAGRLVDALPS